MTNEVLTDLGIETITPVKSKRGRAKGYKRSPEEIAKQQATREANKYQKKQEKEKPNYGQLETTN